MRALTSFPSGAPAWADFGINAERFRVRLADIEPFTPAEGLRCFYSTYSRAYGKTRWGDKTPLYCRRLARVWAVLPGARVVHVLRDGRDVAVSLRDMWFAPSPSIEALARYWLDNVATARRDGRDDPRYLEVRYEDLVTDPETALRRLCAWLDLTFEPVMLHSHEGASHRLREHRARVTPDGQILVSMDARRAKQSRTTQPPDTRRVGRWREVLSPAEAACFEAAAGELLDTLGYGTQSGSPSRADG